MTDLWKERSAGMVCATCMYFTLKMNTLGRCRRHAPTMKGFPAVFDQDWCGDHKLDERAAPAVTEMSETKKDEYIYESSPSPPQAKSRPSANQHAWVDR